MILSISSLVNGQASYRGTVHLEIHVRYCMHLICPKSIVYYWGCPESAIITVCRNTHVVNQPVKRTKIIVLRFFDSFAVGHNADHFLKAFPYFFRSSTLEVSHWFACFFYEATCCEAPYFGTGFGAGSLLSRLIEPVASFSVRSLMCPKQTSIRVSFPLPDTWCPIRPKA